jgi:leucyl aminopeptidase (aminopeptidase T)
MPMKRAVRRLLKEGLGLRRDEKLLVLCDPPFREIGRLILDESRALDAASAMLETPEIGRDGFEPSAGMAAFAGEFKAMVLATSRTLAHSDALRRALARGSRIYDLAGASAESLSRHADGPVKETVEKSRKIADIFTIGRQARLTSPAGTDLTFSIARMKGVADTGFAVDPGQISSFPGGEGCVSPVPESSEGTIVIDGSVPGLGKLANPVMVTVRKGLVTRITGGAEAERFRRLLRTAGRRAKLVAEIGIGTNASALITGKSQEDGKALGSAHAAFESAVSPEGGVSVLRRVDGVLNKPTLTIDDKVIVENGTINV